MSAHLSDELPLLLTGEANRDEVLAAAAHLRGCDDCLQELVSAVVAHASLSSLRRFAPEVMATRREPAEPVAAQSAGPAALPDLSAVFAQVRAEAAGVEAPDRRRPGSRYYRVAAVAAAAIVVGGGIAAAVALTNGGSRPAPTAERIQLAAFDKGRVNASATVSDGRMRLDASALPAAPSGRRYEVWLTNSARTRMQPIGWIGADGTATLTVPGTLMNTFSDVEVSVQDVTAPTYQYSGTSVLRGAY